MLMCTVGLAFVSTRSTSFSSSFLSCSLVVEVRCTACQLTELDILATSGNCQTKP